MSYNGSGTFNINSAGQPVVTGTVISSTAFNALTADLGTGLSTAITKDGQTVATARIPFAAGINSSLVTDATNTTTGSIITAGGVGIAKALFVGTTANIAGTTTLAGVTATSITDSGLTAGRVTYAGTAGLLQDSANLTFNGSALAVTGTLSATGTLSGGTSGTGYSFSGSAPAGSLTLDSSGNLGVGTASPLSLGAGYTSITVNNATTGGGVVFAAGGVQKGAVFNGGNAVYLDANNAAGVINFRNTSTGATMQFDASGNLGLGVTPSAWGTAFGTKVFDIGAVGSLVGSNTDTLLFNNTYWNGTNFLYKTTAFATQYQQVSGQHIWFTAPSGTAGNAITFTQAMTLDASGNLLVGGTSNSVGARAIIENATGSQVGIRYTGIATYYLNVTSGGDLGFSKDGTERMRIDSSGNLLVGTTTQTATFNATYTGTSQGVSYNYASNASFTQAVVHAAMAGTSASAQLFLGRNNNTTAVFYVDGAGAIYSTSIVITSISDQRLKENVRDIDTGLSSIMALKPRRFDWKEGRGQNKKDAAGFVAQEFKTVFPKSVSTGLVDSDGTEYLTMNHEELIPSLVKAIQEQQAIITALTTRITALENK